MGNFINWKKIRRRYLSEWRFYLDPVYWTILYILLILAWVFPVK